ncbi:MAG: protein translocase subunit SecF [Rhodospirillum sp.]|nr:protein translocase subunit SecF [Rhodospirillum sp.]MCF8490300.1 protein translocase subunit SecF [Rhodospirillum sp.]
MLRPIKFIPDDTRIDFLSKRLMLLVVSTLFLVGCLISVAVQGLNFGIDFSGGILVEVRTAEPANLSDFRSRLNTAVEGEVSLTTFGEDPRDLLIRVPEQPGGEAANTAALARLKDTLGADVEYRRTELVGPKVGGELVEAGILAMGLSILIIAAYIWFRFEWQYAVGGIIALLHDVIATIGLFSLFQIQFDLTSVAAVLTVAGYSINDTVVIFDRVREEMRRYKKLSVGEVLNLSINKTLSRTILTSGTTVLAVGCLFLFGGEVLRGFSLAIIWGIFVGTYSSIYVAVPSLIYFNFSRGGEVDPDAPVDEDPLVESPAEDGAESTSGEALAARAAAAEKAAAEEAAKAKPLTPGRVVGKAKGKRNKR